MNVQITFDPIEMLKNIDRSTLWNYVKNTISDKEKEELEDSLYSADSDTLWEALELKVEEEDKNLAIFVGTRMTARELLENTDLDDIIKYIKEDTYHYVSDDIGELISQIRISGCMDEVTELFEMKYTG